MRKVSLTELLMIKIHAISVSRWTLPTGKNFIMNATFLEAVKYSDMGRARAL